MTTAAPPMRFSLGSLLPLSPPARVCEEEDIVVLTVLPLKEERPAQQPQGAQL